MINQKEVRSIVALLNSGEKVNLDLGLHFIQSFDTKKAMTLYIAEQTGYDCTKDFDQLGAIYSFCGHKNKHTKSEITQALWQFLEVEMERLKPRSTYIREQISYNMKGLARWAHYWSLDTDAGNSQFLFNKEKDHYIVITKDVYLRSNIKKLIYPVSFFNGQMVPPQLFAYEELDIPNEIWERRHKPEHLFIDNLPKLTRDSIKYALLPASEDSFVTFIMKAVVKFDNEVLDEGWWL